jgi:carbamoyltransferase
MLDGEYKVMGMAPYGDPSRVDLGRLIRRRGRGFEVDTQYVNTVGLRRHKEAGIGYYFSDKLIEWLGPRRKGEIADEPYIHYAAAMQKLFEEWCLELLETYLGDILRETGRLAFAGGGALNVKLNQRILALDHVQQLFVQPAAGDSGTSLGAATFVAAQRGERVPPMSHVYLGPSYSNAECLVALEDCRAAIRWQILDEVPKQTAQLLALGHPVAWFHGRLEFGPRALGGRSILGCPSVVGISDRINEQIKFRERWRPFCPSILDRIAPEVLQTSHPAPFMTITFDVAEQWKSRIPEVVHEDGTARVQVVQRDTSPRYYELLEHMEALTGNGVVLNTSLNRRGEPMVCCPADALDMFLGSDLEYLVLEDYLVTKVAGD